MRNNGYGVDIYNLLNNNFVGKKIDENTKNNIKQQIISHISTISHGAIKPEVEVSAHPTDPYTMNIDLKTNVPWDTGHMPVLDPAKEITHNWDNGPKSGIFVCSKCKLKKLKIENKNLDTLHKHSHISIADYNLSCEEMLIKDVIE